MHVAGLVQRDALAEAADWATDNRPLLIEVGDQFLDDDWPTLTAVGRAALRRGDRRDYFALLRSIPAPLGYVTPEGVVVLRVRGLALCPRAENVLHDFLRVMWLAVQRLIWEESEEPTVTSQDLRETLGLSGRLADRVSKLVLAEDWMFGGGSSHEGEWSRRVTEQTRFLLDVRTVGDYLRVEAGRLWSPPVDQLAPRKVAQQPQGQEAPQSAPFDFNPLITAASRRLLADGHYDDAVRASAIAFFDGLREMTNLDLEGQSLVGAAFGGDSPAIRIGLGDEQKGWHRLAEGVVSALRNPLAHSALRLERDEALEAIATMSLILRRSARATNSHR